MQVELFGLMPDPTTIVTLGLLLIVGRLRWLLLPIPIMWCWISGATLWAMDMPEFWVMPAAACILAIQPLTPGSQTESIN